jgi:hypothetical protein
VISLRDTFVCKNSDYAIELPSLAFRDSVPWFYSLFAIDEDLGDFYPAFFVDNFGAKCFSVDFSFLCVRIVF